MWFLYLNNVKGKHFLAQIFGGVKYLLYLCTRNQIQTGMIKSKTINIGYQAKKDNAGGNGLIGNINVQTPCGQGV